MRDEIIIKIDLERLNNEIGKINNLIKGIVFDLNAIEGIEVKNYTQIKTEMINPNKSQEVKK